MDHQDSDHRQQMSGTNVKKSSVDAKKDSSDEPKHIDIGGRENISQLSLISGGRGEMLRMLQKGSIEIQREQPLKDDTHKDAYKGDTSQPGVSGRGQFLAMLKTPPENVLSHPVISSAMLGRGIMLSKLRSAEPVVSSMAMETSPSEISSTTDALAQFRLNRREEAAHSTAAQSLHDLEADAAPFEEDPVNVISKKRGEAGTPMNALTNYVRLEVEPNKGIFVYELRFEPEAHSNQLRFALLRQILEVIGQTRIFDGVTLCLPIQLPDRVTQVRTKNPNDVTDVVITLIYKGRKNFAECEQFYGVLFANIMKILKFIRFGTKDFDPKQPKVIPQHKLEIWPGYVSAVKECSNGVMVCVDVAHRVLRQTAVIDILQHARQSAHGNEENFKKNFEQAIIGAIVLTRYNNKTYRIDDIEWDQNPTNTFPLKNGEAISYVQYYKSQYNIEIKNLKQPLLISHKKVRVFGKKEKETQTCSIIPEISHLTGLTDEQRSDFRIMRDVASITRITPNQRDYELKKYCKRVNDEPKTRQLLADWGLRLMDRGVELEVRQLDEESVMFANNKSFGVGPNADFGEHSTRNQQIIVVSLTNWLVIYTKNDHKVARAFIDCMERNSRPMGIDVRKPNVIALDNDRNNTWAETLRQALSIETQIVVCICPTSRDDRYSMIKRICCAESPIPSQVINARTLNNEAKNRSIVQKIALQMNCKMGGSLWSIRIPLKNAMIIGIDSYLDKEIHSVSALVASTNETYTQWYSKAIVQNRNEELVHGLVVSFQHALAAYKKCNDKYPEKIIIFRDGVGDGQLKTVKNYELAQLKQACASISEDYKPLFTFVVVQKHVNTRFYVKTGNKVENPLPGTVLDHTITRRGLQDFYLVPQSVRQGTVMPTHCIVVADENGFWPDIIQRLTYKLCFLYYNWPGAVRVPACCQYAHKLAFLVGQSLKREPAETLNDRLFYL